MGFSKAIFEGGIATYETVASLLYALSRLKIGAMNAFSTDDRIEGKVLLVAMNGPTLETDMKRIPASLENIGVADVAVANHFADMELYEKMKPRFYFFSDPYFWSDNAHPTLLEKRNATLKRIVSQTSWPLTIYFPSHIASDNFRRFFAQHDRIDLRPFNAAAVPANLNWLLEKAWSSNLSAPFAQNVLAHALYGGIQLGYKEIWLAGANYSFHDNIHIDQNDNTFIKMRKHVYGFSTEIAFMDHTRTKRATVSTEFKAIYNAFRVMDSLSRYAQKKGCRIINYSDYSYLDMFERPPKSPRGCTSIDTPIERTSTGSAF